MAKKNDEVILTKEEFKVLQKVAQSKTVIQVGDSVPTNDERLEQYREISADLRMKVAISIKEKACLQAEIDKLKLITERDDDGMLSLMEGMEREMNMLKMKNSEYSDIGPELTGLRNKVRNLESKNKSLTNELEVEVKTRDIQVDELTVKNKELQTELDIRIQQDDRFNNLDL
jgi:hypothetical protein